MQEIQHVTNGHHVGETNVGHHVGKTNLRNQLMNYLASSLDMLYGERRKDNLTIACQTFLSGLDKRLQPVAIAWARWWELNHCKVFQEDQAKQSYRKIFLTMSHLQPAELQVLQDIAHPLPVISCHLFCPGCMFWLECKHCLSAHRHRHVPLPSTLSLIVMDCAKGFNIATIRPTIRPAWQHGKS